MTDEIYLFLFHVDLMVITTYELNHDFSDDDFGARVDRKRVVAHAEKAFVSLLRAALARLALRLPVSSKTEGSTARRIKVGSHYQNPIKKPSSMVASTRLQEASS